MTRHLLYLLGCGLRNRLLRQLRRLRTPRYAIAALIGIAYFWLAFGGFRVGNDQPDAMAEPLIGLANLIGPLALALFVSWWWIGLGRRRPLKLSPTETHMLLPAPITRRQVIQLKLLQAQAGALISAGIGTILLRGGALPWPVRLLSLWLLISTLYLHQVGASLVRTAAEEQGRRGIRSSAVPLTVFAIMFGTLALALVRALVDIRAAASLSFAAERLTAMLQETGPDIVLAPFRLLLGPTVATSFEEWAPAFAGAAVLLVLHYLWVQRTDAAFEEAASEAGARDAELIRAMKAGGLGQANLFGSTRIAPARPWLPLQPTGLPAYAIFWKNTLYSQRLFRPFTLILLATAATAMILAAAVAADTVQEGLRAAGVVVIVLSGVLTLFGPLTVRNDLRTDLRYSDLLRTWPVGGTAVVAAEIAASTATISLAQLILLATGLALLAGSATVPVWLGLTLFAAAALILPILNGLGICLQNAIALLFPGWVRLGEHGGGGIEDFGQNIMLFVATLVLLVISLVPPILVAASIAGQITMQIGTSAEAVIFVAATAAVAAIATIAGEVALFIWGLGHLYETTDPVAAGLLTR
ncbi:hypothetical protein BH23GEM10_BH23GEM10_13200 [soil metagenome]